MDNYCTTIGNPHANYGQKAPIQYYEHQILIKGHTAWCRPRYTCLTKRHNGAVPRIRSHKSMSVPLRHSKYNDQRPACCSLPRYRSFGTWWHLMSKEMNKDVTITREVVYSRYSTFMTRKTVYHGTGASYLRSHSKDHVLLKKYSNLLFGCKSRIYSMTTIPSSDLLRQARYNEDWLPSRHTVSPGVMIYMLISDSIWKFNTTLMYRTNRNIITFQRL